MLTIRWGDSRSAAFGDLDGYGTSLKLPITECILQWGYPESIHDVSLIFQKFVKGEISSLPWCDTKLQNESSKIESNLSDLNAMGILTIASQPAVDGIFSSDSIFGWGPNNGLIFQKSYVECFMSPELLDLIMEKTVDYPFITYFAVNSDVITQLT